MRHIHLVVPYAFSLKETIIPSRVFSFIFFYFFPYFLLFLHPFLQRLSLQNPSVVVSTLRVIYLRGGCFWVGGGRRAGEGGGGGVGEWERVEWVY